jgi:hypothetical protein
MWRQSEQASKIACSGNLPTCLVGIGRDCQRFLQQNTQHLPRFPWVRSQCIPVCRNCSRQLVAEFRWVRQCDSFETPQLRQEPSTFFLATPDSIRQRGADPARYRVRQPNQFEPQLLKPRANVDDSVPEVSASRSSTFVAGPTHLLASFPN